MNTAFPTDREAIGLVEVIQFKWLMGHEGTQVHVERLLEDPVYAELLLAQAETSGTSVLVSAAQALRRALQQRHADDAEAPGPAAGATGAAGPAGTRAG